MKKLVLVALAVLLSAATFAQFSTPTQCRDLAVAKATNDLPNWTPLGTPFVAQDINGVTVDIQAILNSGKGIVIDYSCTWCGPCWTMHQSGLLEALDALPDIQVIWVEIETSNTTAAIYGDPAGGTTQGNWTVDANNNPVPYPIIDDRSCLDMCYALYEGYVPSIYFIAPGGYFCSVYGDSWGFGSSTSPAAACAAITNLMNNAPAAGQAPLVSITGMNTAILGNTTNFGVDIISVDNVTSVEWVFTNGNPSTATGTNVSTTWSNTGSEMVICTVTNTTGVTSDTMYVNVIEWNWGDEMSYCGTDSYASSVGAGGALTWGAKYPAGFMAGRNYLDNVKVYSGYDCHFTLSVYQTNPNGEPSTSDLLYQYTYPINAEAWNTLTIYDRVALDDTKDLWVVFDCSDASYPAACSNFCGDPNGSLVCYQGTWDYIYNLNSSLQYTWMIKTTTSATAPAMNVSIAGPTSAMANDPVTFSVAGPSAATYAWTIEGGNPATANGNSVNVTWAAAGTYNVSVTASLDGETATASMTVSVVSCDPVNLPFTCGFEANDNLGCWSFVDKDGDGYGWCNPADYFSSVFANSGEGSIASASYINNIGVLSPDNWMITPEIVIPAEGATLSWFVGAVDASYYQEYYSVLVSTTGSATSNFTNTIFAGTIDNANFTKKSRSLGGFAGQTIRIAFRHHNISDMYWMVIDDIAVTAGNHADIENVEDVNVALYPNPVTSKLNINAEGVQEVSIIDVNGRTVMTQQNANTIDMSEMANGVYFVRVITNNGVSTQKIVKK